jgi:hypothetical protein
MVDMSRQLATRDTCPNIAAKDACVIEEEWDRDAPVAARVHTLVRIVKKCSVHAALSDAECRAAVVDENVRKNVTLSITSEHYSLSLNEENLAALMGTVEWSFDGSRVLLVTIPTASGADISTIQSSCNLQFGPGMVVIT